MIDLQFGSPIFLAIFVILIIYFFWKSRKSSNTPLPVIRYSDTQILRNVPVTLRVRLRAIPDVFITLAILLIAFSLSQPQIGLQSVSITGAGVDIVMALDISNSMTTPDFVPNRLEAAKAVMSDFVQRRTTDRIGLVAFAEESFYLSPPTLTHSFVFDQLEKIQPASDIGLGERTAIGLGLASSINMLRDSSATERIVILLTDGVNNAGSVDPLTAAEAARALGIRVYVVRMARPEGEGLDTNPLSQLALITGGEFFQADESSNLNEIYTQIDELETSDYVINTFEWHNQADLLVLIAIILLLFERILRRTVFQTIP